MSEYKVSEGVRRLGVFVGGLFVVLWLAVTLYLVFSTLNSWGSSKVFYMGEKLSPQAYQEAIGRIWPEYRNAILLFGFGGLFTTFIPYFFGVGLVRLGNRFAYSIKWVKEGFQEKGKQ